MDEETRRRIHQTLNAGLMNLYGRRAGPLFRHQAGINVALQEMRVATAGGKPRAELDISRNAGRWPDGTRRPPLRAVVDAWADRPPA